MSPAQLLGVGGGDVPVPVGPGRKMSPGLPCSHYSGAYRKGRTTAHLSLTPDAMALSHLLLWRARWGQGVAILAGVAEAPRGRVWDLGGDTVSLDHFLHSPQLSPFPKRLPGAAPTEQRSPLACRNMVSRTGPPTLPTVDTRMVRAPSPESRMVPGLEHWM